MWDLDQILAAILSTLGAWVWMGTYRSRRDRRILEAARAGIDRLTAESDETIRVTAQMACTQSVAAERLVELEKRVAEPDLALAPAPLGPPKGYESWADVDEEAERHFREARGEA